MIVHPGELVLSKVLLPANLSIRQAATRLNISPESLAEVVCGQGPMTRELAASLAREFGYSREGWLELQRVWDEERHLAA